MSDFLEKCPSVARELIFRYLSMSEQQRLSKAYKNTKFSSMIEEFKYHREEISCWKCVCAIWIEWFWSSVNAFDKENGGYEFGAMRAEPAHNTQGFKLLYTFQERNSFYEREVYRLRKFNIPEETKPADDILKRFIDECESVYKAKSVEDLQQHIQFAHDGIGHMPEMFFRPLIDHEGNY